MALGHGRGHGPDHGQWPQPLAMSLVVTNDSLHGPRPLPSAISLGHGRGHGLDYDQWPKAMAMSLVVSNDLLPWLSVSGHVG